MTELDPKERDRIMRKIKHCLALSKSANEHEAAAAMRQAQALMRKFRLTDMDVKVSDVGETKSDIEMARRPLWDMALSTLVGDVFGCRVLDRSTWSDAKGCRVKLAVFIGVNPAPEIAKYAYESLYRQLKKARASYVADIRSMRGRQRPTPETQGNHFAIGWLYAVEEKIRALVPTGEDGEPEQVSASDSKALIAIESNDKALIDAYLAGRVIKKARDTRTPDLDPFSQYAGMLAGERAVINPGVASAGADVLALESDADAES
ncbi:MULTISPECIES: DUF7168 domain-containing protein [Pseudomonas]|uniref:DUF2786 domain-containing protein n=1 Tax=Pseudomonas lutea TaxID=243924 RepID=A0A9X8QLR3_9PSED|nr:MULTISPECIES: DUF2786 domain-containing protein [Pseudomonas]SER36966.1 Protein of unknown function [Pseudomonas lutea]